MPTINGVSCNVKIDGVPIPEYGTETEASTIKCSIVAEENKSFAFSLDFANSAAPIHVYNLHADGILLARLSTQKRDIEAHCSVLNVNGVLERRQLKFSKLETGMSALSSRPFPYLLKKRASH